MTTGRINQITNLSGHPPARGADAGTSGGPNPPADGGESCAIRKGRNEAPGRRGSPGAPGEDADDHPIAPTKPLETSPTRRCSNRVALTGGGWLRHVALGWRDRTPRARRRTADTTGRLPPGISVSGVASGQPSTDSSSAGDQEAPGLRLPTRHDAGPTGITEPPGKGGRDPRRTNDAAAGRRPPLRQDSGSKRTSVRGQGGGLSGREEVQPAHNRKAAKD